MLLYGLGLRLMECLRLRVKDIEFDRHKVLVREGKGNKDRVTMLAAAVVPRLRADLEGVRRLHAADLAAGFGCEDDDDLHPCPQTRWLRRAEPRRWATGPGAGGAIGSGMRFVSEWRVEGGCACKLLRIHCEGTLQRQDSAMDTKC